VVAKHVVDLAILDEVGRMNLTAHGRRGRIWVEALSGIVDELRGRWDLSRPGWP
jgi:hypothetical protein